MLEKNATVIDFKEISPNVRYVNLLQCPPAFHEGPRMIYDHQFIYVHKGKGVIEIDGSSYRAVPGDLFFYGPAVAHSLSADEKEPFLLSGIHFDFTGKFADRQFPIGPFGISVFSYELVTEQVQFRDFSGFPAQINLFSDDRVAGLIIEMVREFDEGSIFSGSCINGLFSAWLSMVARHTALRGTGIKLKNDVIDQVIRHIHDHYNENLTNKDIGERFHFNPNYLNELMVARTGVSLRQYLIDIRMKKALNLIINTGLSISDIARAIGYNDIHYFSRIFKKKTGFSPEQIKQKL